MWQTCDHMSKESQLPASATTAVDLYFGVTLHAEARTQSLLRFARASAMILVGSETFAASGRVESPAAILFLQLSAVFWVLLSAAAFTRHSRAATLVAWFGLATGILATFPDVANHTWGLSLTLLVLGLCDERDQKQRQYAMLIITVLVASIFAYSGLQKMLSGLWFEGEMPAWLASSDPTRFALLSSIADATGQTPSSGEWSGALALGVSNLVWVGEIAIGVGLMTRRFRRSAAVAAVVLLVLIEVDAKEFHFGGLALLLTAFSTGWSPAVITSAIATTAVAVYSVLIAVGVV